jgi:hypothetical protein
MKLGVFAYRRTVAVKDICETKGLRFMVKAAKALREIIMRLVLIAPEK